MKAFNIGDKVVALTNPSSEHSQPRIKGKMYIVVNLMYCQKCGEQMISLGLKSKNSLVHCTCNHLQNNDGFHFTLSKHFAKVDEFDQEIEEAIKDEEYEIAALLRDLKIANEKRNLVNL